jgi:hypothetical protein
MSGDSTDTETDDWVVPTTPHVLEFCKTPRTLIEILDHFTGYGNVLEELDRMDKRVHQLKHVCYNSLYASYKHTYSKIRSRIDTSEEKENYEHVDRRLQPLLRHFIDNANQVLNRFNDKTIQDIQEEFQWGPRLKITETGMIDVEVLLKEHYYTQLSVYDGMDTTELRQLFFEFDREPFDEELFRKRYINRNRELDKHLENMWYYIRFSAQWQIPPDVDQDMLRRDIQHYCKARPPPLQCECVGYAYTQQQEVDQIREQLQKRIHGSGRIDSVVNHVIDMVQRGHMEVANTYQRKTYHAQFIFATRLVKKAIHQQITDVPRGSMVCINDELKIRYQRLAPIQTSKRRYDGMLAEQYNSTNIALTTGGLQRKYHKMPITIDLRRLVPYFTKIKPTDEYDDKEEWDSLTT